MVKPARRVRRNITIPWKKGIFFCAVIAVFSGLLIRSFQKSHFISSLFRTNILLINEAPVLVSFPKNDQDFTVLIHLPQNLLAFVPFGYDEYQLSTLPKLAAIEKKPQLVPDTIVDLLSIPVHTTITLNHTGKSSETILNDLKFCLLKGFIAACNMEKLSLIDKLSLFVRLFSNSRIVDIYAQKYVTKDKLNDGTEVLRLKYKELDTELEANLQDEVIRAENITVVVQNNTDTPNVGRLFARFITNIGGKITTVNNLDEEVDNCIISGNEKLAKKRLVIFLQEEFGCKFQNQQNLEVSAELLVSVGKTFGERWKRSGY